MPIPEWANDPKLRIGFLIRLAALHHNETGSLALMAHAIGTTKHTFYTAMERGKTTPMVAASLELLLGRDVAKREDFCPDTE